MINFRPFVILKVKAVNARFGVSEIDRLGFGQRFAWAWGRLNV